MSEETTADVPPGFKPFGLADGMFGLVGPVYGRVVDGEAHAARLGLHRLEALLDRVLVRSRERREHQLATPRRARVDGDLRAVLDRALHGVDVAEVDLRVDALAEEVHAQRHEVHVAGALAVAVDAALHVGGAGVRFGVHGDGAIALGAGAADHPAGYFAAIGDQDAVESAHGILRFIRRPSRAYVFPRKLPRPRGLHRTACTGRSRGRRSPAPQRRAYG